MNFKPFSDSEFLVDVTCQKKQWRSPKAWKFKFRTKDLQRFQITRVKHLKPVAYFVFGGLEQDMLSLRCVQSQTTVVTNRRVLERIEQGCIFLKGFNMRFEKLLF